MIRKEISKIVGFSIGDEKWDEVIHMADATGRMNKAVMIKIITELCKAVEELENKNE